MERARAFNHRDTEDTEKDRRQGINTEHTGNTERTEKDGKW
jgi:hypothetical protein